MKYVHGYGDRENIRLQDQASTLTELLHLDTFYPEGSHVLEAGCGVGAQTVTLVRNSPGALITSVDISENSWPKRNERPRRKTWETYGFSKRTFFDCLSNPVFSTTFSSVSSWSILPGLLRPWWP